MSWELQLGVTDKPRNSTKQVYPAGSYQCLMKDQTSVVEPVVWIKTTRNLSNYNYAFIPAFHRYYYVVNWIPVNAEIWEAHLQVDVLCTYREIIMSTYAFVRYAESDYDTMISDSRLPMTDVVHAEEEAPQKLAFWDAGGSFRLSVASATSLGNNGMADVYALSVSQMKSLAQKLGDRSFVKEVQEYFANPLGMVLSCVWVPMATSGISTPIQLGDFDTGVSGQAVAVSSLKRDTKMFTIELPHKAVLPDGSETYADYRNVEPYAQYTLTLPGVGIIEIPMASMIKDGSEAPHLNVHAYCSEVTGDITYRVNSLATDLAVVKGTLGVQVPIFNANYNVAGALNSFLGAAGSIGSAVMGVATGHAGMAIGGTIGAFSSIVSGVTKMNQSQYTVAGSLGGKENASALPGEIVVTKRWYDTSDTPSSVKKTIGGALFKNKKLGDLTGYVSCEGFHPQVPCTLWEYNQLQALVSYSGREGFGGIIIE